MTDKKNLAAALIKAQKEMAPLLKDTKGNYGKYATLASVQEVCLPALGNHGIAVFQDVTSEWVDNRVTVVVGCELYHAASGESASQRLPLVPVKTDPQGIGSAITYGRRYLLMAMAGIAPEDDDGDAASGVTRKPTQQTQRQPDTTQTPANSHANATTTPAGNTSSIVAETFVNKVIGTWATPADAYKWAADGGFTENEHSARTRWAEIVKTDFGNTCNTSNIKAVMRAYATHYFNKQAATVAA